MPPRAAFQAKQDNAVERMRFRRSPLAAAAVCFALGIAGGRVSAQPAVVLVAAIVLLVGLVGLSWRWAARVAVWPVLGVWVVLGMAAYGWQPGPAVPVRLLAMADGLSRTVRGTVVRVRPGTAVAAGAENDADAAPPWEMAVDTGGESGKPMQVDVALSTAEEVTPDVSRMVPVQGGVRVAVYGDLPKSAAGMTKNYGAGAGAPACGDVVEMPLRMREPVRFRDPGVFQAADFLAGQGIGVQGSVGADKMRVVGHDAAGWRCRLGAAQGWAAGRLAEYVGSRENGRLPVWLRLAPADGEMLDAMLFGDRSGLSHGLRVGFERTGTFHLFVVSGLHIALLAGAVWWVLRRLRVWLWAATVVTIAAAGAYAALTGFGQPAQRALLMTAVYLLARLLGRESDRTNALGAAVLAMLVLAPRSLFEASLQMTVLAIVATGGIAVPLGERTFLRYARVTRLVFRSGSRGGWRGRATREEAQARLMLEVWGEVVEGVLGQGARGVPALGVRWGFWLGELALIGLVAELVMVLPMAMYFHRAAVFALAANMLVIPLIAVLAPLGILTFVGSLVSPWVAVVPGAATALLLHLVRWAIGAASRVHAADVRVPGPVWWVGLLAVVGWGVCCWAVRRSGWGALGAAVALPAIAAMVLWPEKPVVVPGRLEITAIDVGQGDSLLAVSPDGRTMLIDAGGPVGQHGVSEVVANYDVGEEVVSPYLWSRRIRRLDVVALTHAHTDHMGGMPAVLENFRPRELWVSIVPRSALFHALLQEAAELGIRVRFLQAGDEEQFGSVGVDVLGPAVGYGNPGAPRNDDSLVMRMQYGKATALLEGDAERPEEDAMLAAGRLGPVTLLKVGHHGSKTSSNPEFLAVVSPQLAVISSGKRNNFGHPNGVVVQRFGAAGVRLFRTDLFGVTTFLLGADGGVREWVGEEEMR